MVNEQNTRERKNHRNMDDAPGFDTLMDDLKRELDLVLDKLRPQQDEHITHGPAVTADSEQALQLFGKLKVMLENINPECIGLLDELRAVEGTEQLVSQIEDFEFEAAARTLAEIKKLSG